MRERISHTFSLLRRSLNRIELRRFNMVQDLRASAMIKWTLKSFHVAMFVFIFVKPVQPATAGTVRFEVDEEKPKDSFVADISQERVPLGFRRGGFTNIAYEISDLFSSKYLELDRVSGIMRTRVVLDRERLALQNDVLQVQVTVSADAPGLVSALMSVEVKIRDINDNPPSFPKKQEFISISESAPLNSKFRLEVAEDPDLGSNSVDKYEIVKGNKEGFFGLNVKRFSGVNLILVDLMNIKKLDRERNHSFELVIQASDKGHPPLADTKTLNITILDSNDHSPVFSEDLYTAEVKENLPEGTFVLNVNATDKDLGTNAEIRYFIDKKSQNKELFELDNVTGELWTKKVLDYESGQPGRPYRLIITANDQGPDSIPVIAMASIKVIDENDNTPKISIEPKSLFQSDGKLPEDVPLGSVVASVIVSDKDSGRYGEVDLELFTDRDDFSLNKLFDKQYVIQVKRPLSLDVRTQYKLEIVARDRGSPRRKSNKSLTVDLADSNRNAPKFEKSIYTIKLSDDAKPETIVETIAATDADKGTNKKLSFRLVSLFDSHQNTSIVDTEKWFALDALRGSLRLKTKLWCSFTPSFLITAEVRDHGRTPKRSRCTLNVTVTCSKHQYEFRVFERRPPGTKVGDFRADLRLPGKQLLIHLSQGQHPYFTVNNSTGLLTLVKELDREEISSHLLNGFVTDGFVKSPVQVFVRVLDKNDNAPRFIGIDGQISVNIPTNARPGFRVWKVVAKDPDEGRNGKVSYSIVNSNGDDAFTIDGEQGHILISKNLTKKSYIVTIRAADNAARPKQRLVRMKVFLDDTLVLPTLRLPTDNKVAAGINARESEKGAFTNKELIIVIVLCTFCGVLIIMLIAVVVAKYKRKAGANKRSSYHEAEISREDALKASKKMYKDATINMHKSAEELPHAKVKNGKAAPLPKKSPLTNSPPTTDTTWAVRERQSPSTSYMGSEYVGTDCETDSGREDIVHFSPYTTHGPAQKKAHDWRTGSFNSPPQPPPPYTSPRKHCGSPSSTLPLKRERKVGKPSLVKIPGVTHSVTDL